MPNQPYVGCIALCTRKKLVKSGEIRDFSLDLLLALNLLYCSILRMYSRNPLSSSSVLLAGTSLENIKAGSNTLVL